MRRSGLVSSEVLYTSMPLLFCEKVANRIALLAGAAECVCGLCVAQFYSRIEERFARGYEFLMGCVGLEAIIFLSAFVFTIGTKDYRQWSGLEKKKNSLMAGK